jgi:hypothetical protein
MYVHDINTPDEMTRIITHIDIIKETYRLLELEEVVPGRANHAGVHLGAEPTNKIMYDIVMANRVAPEIIAAICLKAVHAEAEVLTEEEQIAFFQFREYFGLLKPAADASRTKNEINSHFKLGSGSRIIRLLTLYGRSQAGNCMKWSINSKISKIMHSQSRGMWDTLENFLAVICRPNPILEELVRRSSNWPLDQNGTRQSSTEGQREP